VEWQKLEQEEAREQQVDKRRARSSDGRINERSHGQI
jgi:hypothetical protein